MTVDCPDCGATATSVGPIPSSDVFAGRILGRPLPGGDLYLCEQCLLGFRWPRPSKRELDSLYKQGDGSSWSQPVSNRRDWRLARGWLEETLPQESRILDLGCFDGSFLEGLASTYRCHGIEIHPEARKRAQDKGVVMAGRDFSEIEERFDCITAFDVIEHLEQPRSFLERGLAALRAGGYFLISTGNLNASSFRLLGARYWYCVIAEHISFVSPEWVSALADPLSYRVIRQARFAHGTASRARQIREALTNVFYWCTPTLFGMVRRLGGGAKNVREHPELIEFPPAWGCARDHFMVLLQKQ